MLIHSVTPRHWLTEQPHYPQTAVMGFPGGQLEGEYTPRGFVISRLYATDPALYLKKEYEPGAVMVNPYQNFRKE